MHGSRHLPALGDPGAAARFPGSACTAQKPNPTKTGFTVYYGIDTPLATAGLSLELASAHRHIIFDEMTCQHEDRMVISLLPRPVSG